MKQPSRGRSGRESGVTLVEVLVALMILAFVALGVTSLLGIAAKQNKLALERSRATGLASGRLSQLASMPFRSADEAADYGLPGEKIEPGPPVKLVSGFGEIPGYPEYRRTVTLDYDTPVAGMLRVKVEVAWWSLAQAREKAHAMIVYLHPALEQVN
jgi:prepilin-type N-terminal cleavage/methylation domain-containing protein